MVEQLADRIIRKIGHVNEIYYRLILLVASSGAGKTAALLETKRRIGAPLININLELSRSLLDLTERQRALQLPKILTEITSSFESNLILLDNIEVLFDISLKQDPLRLLQKISRNKTVVVAWNGYIKGEHLYYATSDHPEYKRYQLQDLLIITPKSEE